MILECFFEAQKEVFSTRREQAGSAIDDETIRRDVSGAIKMVFKETGHDFDNPTAQGLFAVVESLGRKASSWGTPDDIINHHKEQIQKVLQALQSL